MSKISTLLGSVTAPKKNDRVAIVATKIGFLSPEECAEVIRLGESTPDEAGTISMEDNLNTNTRSSRVKYLHQSAENSWLYQRMGLAIEDVNKDAYGYHLCGFEALQIASYSEGDHYGWHMDLGMKDNSTRKLGISIQLTAPEEYEGGDLEFYKGSALASREQGAAIYFPSFMYHRVTPVTRGSRKSLVGWVHGDAFR